MKKIIITASLCVGMLSAALAQNAEPTVNKRGIPLLPQQGDIALGINANPFLKYLGGFMGGNSNADDVAHLQGFNQTIYAKYFLTDRSAVRAKIDFTSTQNKQKVTVANDYIMAIDPTNAAATVFDTEVTNRNSAFIELGYELRRGKGRVQGFYGADVMLELGKEKIRYDYGNPITESNQTPTIGMGNVDPGDPGYRKLTANDGLYFGAGVGGFVGVEYFFAPQISLGGELGLTLSYYNKGQNTYKSEEFLNGSIVEHEWRARNNNTDFQAGLRTRTAGNIFVMFHF